LASKNTITLKLRLKLTCGNMQQQTCRGCKLKFNLYIAYVIIFAAIKD